MQRVNIDISAEDIAFCADFEAGRVAPEAFGHRAHVRLAYIYLVRCGTDGAAERMRAALLGFLVRNGIDRGKYHETITRAWILAVRHFMELSAPARSADEFIDANPILLDAKIMLTHYSAEVLFSAEARAHFTPPDLQPIPRHSS